MSSAKLKPIERQISVSWDPTTAYQRFTAEFASWWPVATHSIGEKRVRHVVFELQVGGRIFEEHQDGRRFQWGRVLELDPPHRVRFTWHPSRDESTAQDVWIEFVPEGTGTRVRLIASGWERWGPKASLARRGYNLGWKYILNVWAGRRTFGMAVVDVIASVVGAVQKQRGGLDGMIAKAGGEIPRS